MPRTRMQVGCWKRLAVGLAAALLMAGCQPVSTPPVAKIGLIAPFEGPSRPLGYGVLHAVQLRVEEWNRSGGVPRVELVALNDDGDADLAARLPSQLAVDPDVLVVIGPPQGQTALAVLPGFAAHRLPALSLAPLPDDHPAEVMPFAGTASELQAALSEAAPGAVVAWQRPITKTTIWAGDPLTLATLRASEAARVPAASSVAAEPAFAGWAGSNADGLVWAGAAADVPPGFEDAYERVAGSPPDPIATLAYAATDHALALMSATPNRRGILDALDSVMAPEMRIYSRRGADCCVPAGTEP